MAAKPVACRARVTAVRALASEVLEAELAMVDPPTLAFDAGQWVSVPFGPKTVRAYSIASTPRLASALTLCADVAPGGLGSRWFRGLRAGDDVEFKGPLGGFVWTPGETRRPVFAAEEIGIVPIRAILTDLDEQGMVPAATLVYWGRDADWLVYDADFRALARRHPAFAYHPIVRSADRSAADELACAVDRLVTDMAGRVGYVAGGEAAINRVRDKLMAKGLERRAVKWEKFW
jgi:phenol hydroxylase P5 protein